MGRILIYLLPVCLLAGCGGPARGEAIHLPQAENIGSVTVVWGERTASSRDRAYIARLLEAMEGARSTGESSVQDTPRGGAWLARIDFGHRGGGASTVFLYPRNGRLYLEQPYQGIFEADSALAVLVGEVGQ